MAKRRKWNPDVTHHYEPVSELKHSILIALLGDLIYKEISSFRELQNRSAPTIATRSEESHLNSERKVANE